MPSEKILSIDLVEIAENKCIEVRTKTIVMENGKQLSATFHRHVIAPGDDYSKEDAQVQSICSATHIASVVDAYRMSQTA
jgi:hypothetical protein